jgi:hypothetical protein
MIIQSDNLPTIKGLIDKLQTDTDFFGDSGHAAFSGVARPAGRRQFCYNCDTIGHVLFDCTKPKASCEECGEKGHLTKHCYVRSDMPLPSGMNAERKQKITAQRAAYQAGKAGTAMTALETLATSMTCQYIDEDESFLEMMQREGH